MRNSPSGSSSSRRYPSTGSGCPLPPEPVVPHPVLQVAAVQLGVRARLLDDEHLDPQPEDLVQRASPEVGGPGAVHGRRHRFARHPACLPDPRCGADRGRGVGLRRVTGRGDRPAGIVRGLASSGATPRSRRHRHRLRQLDHRPPVRRPRRRARRARCLRRHVPQRRLHPDQDVRLPRRRGAARAAREPVRHRREPRQGPLDRHPRPGLRAHRPDLRSAAASTGRTAAPTSPSTRATPGSPGRGA